MSAAAGTATRKRSAGGLFTWTAAAVVWFIGVWTTTSFLNGMGVASGSDLVFGLIIQIGLTRLESAVWAGKASKWTWGAFGFDIFLNAGGIWPYTRNFWNTQTGAMFNDITLGAFGYTLQNIIIDIGITINMGQVVAGLITIALAILIAYSPEGILTSGR
jgi:hypothetical protein